MKKIESLTTEQEALIPIYLKKYYDRVYNGAKLDREKAKKSIKYIYTNSGYKIPYIWFCQSPLQAQIIINLLKNKDKDNLGANLEANLWANLRVNLWDNLGDNLGDNLVDNLRANLRTNLGANLGANLWANLGDNLRANLEANLWANLEANLWDNLGANLEANLWATLEANLWDNLGDNLRDLKFESFSWYGNISDYGWTCFYDFINHELIPTYKTEIWSNWLDLIDCNIYDMIQMDGLCIVIEMPTVVNVNDNKRLNSKTSEAVKFSDGYSVYAWNGIIIPEKWIKQKESITKDDIIKETNAEKRRCLQEILGSNQYVKLLNIEVIDEDIDGCNNSMKLFKTKEPDNLINEHIFFLNVICPSTKREYYLCVPECTNVWEAKQWTFQNQKIEIRHGDVGLVNIAKQFNKPIIES